MRKPRPRQPRSAFEIVYEGEREFVIRDLDDCGLSVTNDAERVVQLLHRCGYLDSRQKRLLCYDSSGELSELKHDGKGVFRGFAAIERTAKS